MYNQIYTFEQMEILDTRSIPIVTVNLELDIPGKYRFQLEASFCHSLIPICGNEQLIW